MKIKYVIFTPLVFLVSLVSCSDYPSSRIDKKVANTLCNATPVITDGAEIDTATAHNLIKDYRNAYDNPEVMAHHIGLDILKEFCAQADSFNANTQVPDSMKIVGYRFFNAISSRELYNSNDPDVPINITDKNDLVAVPVRKNGTDFFKVYDYPFINPIKLFSYFRPCPRICGK